MCPAPRETAPAPDGRRACRSTLCGREWLAGVDEDANYLFQIPAATPKNPPQQRKRDRDRAERMRLAGGPMPSLREKAYAFARQRTIVRTSDFTAIGIPRHYLAWMCEEGWLVREGYGLYRAAEREAA
ncbi:type IV toxin-antitoxin system AbiEi family antitoxin domain-containing protein [Methylobacterium ajmalii]|uniref:Type IV toxin-antitoxin system AbiEi family antitoxin domain-containing protein n=2 Tax=Hyphomicrobiales TaxID=356 RepID=A0ABU9ZUW9_9HYPH